MGCLFRLLTPLVGLALALVVLAWVLLTQTGVVARFASAGFNEGQADLFLEMADVRLDAGLLGARVEGLAVRDKASGDALVSLDHAHARLAGLPASDFVSVDDVEVRGVRVRVDRAGVGHLEKLRRERQATREAGEEGTGRPARVRLGRVHVEDVDVSVRLPEATTELEDLAVDLSGMAGPEVALDLTLRLPRAEVSAKGGRVALADLSLHGVVEAKATDLMGGVQMDQLTLARLEAPGVTLEGLSLTGLEASMRGLVGEVTITDLALARAAVAGLGPLEDLHLDAKASGGVTGVSVPSFSLRTGDQRLDASGAAMLRLGLSGKSLPLDGEGRFDLRPERLFPSVCAGTARLEGSFRLGGDLLKGAPRLTRLDATLTGPEGPRELHLEDLPLAGAADGAALLDALCRPAPPAPAPEPDAT